MIFKPLIIDRLFTFYDVSGVWRIWELRNDKFAYLRRVRNTTNTEKIFNIFSIEVKIQICLTLALLHLPTYLYLLYTFANVPKTSVKSKLASRACSWNALFDGATVKPAKEYRGVPRKLQNTNRDVRGLLGIPLYSRTQTTDFLALDTLANNRIGYTTTYFYYLHLLFIT